MVDSNYATEVPHIYAVGDVIGFPALAATSMDQGRLAASHAFGEPARELQALQPIGIYTIPEISYCGKLEADLTTESVPFEVGISRYRELARGQITGDSYGMLKLIVHADTREILGVHVFGTNATELVHIGQAIMGCGGTVDYLVDTVLNYPTLSEAYKVAALDVTNKLRAVARFSTEMVDLRAQHACRTVQQLAPSGPDDSDPRRTATTLPRIVAWLPSIGSYAGLCGSSHTCSSVRLKVLTVASLSSSAATMSPLIAVGCCRTTTQSPSQMAASIIESPSTSSRNIVPSPTSWRGSAKTSSTRSSARIGPPAAIRPSTGTCTGAGYASPIPVSSKSRPRPAERCGAGRGRTAALAGQQHLERPRPVRVAAQESLGLQHLELVGDAGRRGQPDRVTHLADARRIAAALHRRP